MIFNSFVTRGKKRGERSDAIICQRIFRLKVKEIGLKEKKKKLFMRHNLDVFLYSLSSSIGYWNNRNPGKYWAMVIISRLCWNVYNICKCIQIKYHTYNSSSRFLHFSFYINFCYLYLINVIWFVRIFKTEVFLFPKFHNVLYWKLKFTFIKITSHLYYIL